MQDFCDQKLEKGDIIQQHIDTIGVTMLMTLTFHHFQFYTTDT